MAYSLSAPEWYKAVNKKPCHFPLKVSRFTTDIFISFKATLITWRGHERG